MIAPAEYLGHHFIAYVLGTDEWGDRELSPTQVAVMAQLEKAAEALSVLGPRPAAEYLARTFGPSGTSPATQLRESCGGGLAEVDEPVEVDDRILRFAQQIYPVFLVKPPKLGHGISPIRPYLQMDDREYLQFAELFLRDDSVKNIFAGATVPPGGFTTRSDAYQHAHSIVHWSTNGGGSFTPDQIVGKLLHHAWKTYQISEGETEGDYLSAVRGALKKIRALGRSEIVRVPHLVGLTNIQLAGTERVDLGSMELRASDSRLADVILDQHEGLGSARVILLVDYPLQLMGSWPASNPASPGRFMEVRKQSAAIAEGVNSKIVLARMAVLLGYEDGIAGTQVLFQKTIDPLEIGGSWPGNLQSYDPLPEVELTPQHHERVTSWATLVGDIQSAGLLTGMRRILSSVGERHDPGDSLVDAVTSWESLFGAPQETVLRVVGSMAKVLEADPQKRAELYTKIKKVYDTRSKLVHGNPDGLPPDLWEPRQRAIQWAISAYRTVLESDDLRRYEKSIERGLHVLLT